MLKSLIKNIYFKMISITKKIVDTILNDSNTLKPFKIYSYYYCSANSNKK